MKYREITRAIENKVPGGRTRAGKENNRWAVLDGQRVLRVTYPSIHSGADIPKGTLHAIREPDLFTGVCGHRHESIERTGSWDGTKHCARRRTVPAEDLGPRARRDRSSDLGRSVQGSNAAIGPRDRPGAKLRE